LAERARSSYAGAAFRYDLAMGEIAPNRVRKIAIAERAEWQGRLMTRRRQDAIQLARRAKREMRRWCVTLTASERAEIGEPTRRERVSSIRNHGLKILCSRE
jgi:hypothetical protein